MSGFWDLSDGTSATTTGTEYEAPTGNFDVIPDGSSVLAMIDEVKWDKNKDGTAEFISARWTIISPDEYKNRKIFHKLWVTDDDPGAKDAATAAKKRDRARRMLAAIDANAGSGLSKVAGKPGDQDLLSALANRPMIIRLSVWSQNDNQRPGQTIEGNWVSAVSPASKGIDVKPAPLKKPESFSASVLNDDIPF